MCVKYSLFYIRNNDESGSYIPLSCHKIYNTYTTSLQCSYISVRLYVKPSVAQQNLHVDMWFGGVQLMQTVISKCCHRNRDATLNSRPSTKPWRDNSKTRRRQPSEWPRKSLPALVAINKDIIGTELVWRDARPNARGIVPNVRHEVIGDIGVWPLTEPRSRDDCVIPVLTVASRTAERGTPSIVRRWVVREVTYVSPSVSSAATSNMHEYCDPTGFERRRTSDCRHAADPAAVFVLQMLMEWNGNCCCCCLRKLNRTYRENEMTFETAPRIQATGQNGIGFESDRSTTDNSMQI